MPLNADVAGYTGEPRTEEIDARWTMAYSAGLGDNGPCYMDTLRPGGVVAHPLFPVCVEWPVILDMRHGFTSGNFRPEERMRGVHAGHDLTIHRLVKPGDKLTTRATIMGVERRKPGAYTLTRLETTDQNDQPVSTTWQSSIYLGVDLEGPERPATDAPEGPGPITSELGSPTEVTVPVAAGAAHVYSECAHIWNPIHTDAEVARRAGLPAIILHGTATLALGVSRVIEQAAGGDPSRVARIAGRFNAMVLMPSEIVVRIFDPQPSNGTVDVRFEVLNAEGKPAVREGLITLHS